MSDLNKKNINYGALNRFYQDLKSHDINDVKTSINSYKSQTNNTIEEIQNEMKYLKCRMYAMIQPTMVDLGLSVKWATYNIGVDPLNLATAQDWYGNFYAWGELTTKTSYSWDNYKFGTYDNPTKYNTIDGLTTLQPVDDVATMLYGAGYRMPTKTEIEELIALPNEWVKDYNGISGLNGRVFTGNGNTLFIPAAGFYDGSSHYHAGADCYLWSSSLYADDPVCAWYLGFYGDGIHALGDYGRCRGRSVRCVSTI